MRPTTVALSLLVSACAADLRPPAAPAVDRTATGGALPVCRPWTAAPCLAEVGASLRTERSGKPLEGKRVRFVTERMVICDSVTDRTGHASCRGVAPNGRVLAESGYRAIFEGDDRYVAASGRARPERGDRRR